MGLSFGASTGGTSSSTNSSSNQNYKYSPAQSGVQDQVGSLLGANLRAASAGQLSSGVLAQKTQAADQINRNSDTLVDRVNRMLAARGFGNSGESGKATLAAELGRQSGLANNEANFAGIQQGVNAGNLLSALNYAFTQLGTTASGSTSGSSSSWGVNAGGGVGIPGFTPYGGK